MALPNLLCHLPRSVNRNPTHSRVLRNHRPQAFFWCDLRWAHCEQLASKWTQTSSTGSRAHTPSWRRLRRNRTPPGLLRAPAYKSIPSPPTPPFLKPINSPHQPELASPPPRKTIRFRSDGAGAVRCRAGAPIGGARFHSRRGEATAPGTADVLELRDPPRASDLVLPERLAPGARRCEFDDLTYIVAVGPAHLLVPGTQGPNLLHPEYLDVRARTAARVPAVPRELADTLSPRHATGLIADPRCPAHDVVALAQLHPTAGTSMTRHDDVTRAYPDAGTVLQPPPGGRWVILNARVRVSNVPENISFHWEAPPRVSTLFIDAALIPEAHEHLDATVRINSVDPSGWLLLEATHARGITLILCNALARSAAPLPVAGRPPTVNTRSLGLIPVPDARGGGGHCMVAHLKPFCGTNRASLAWYDTRTEVWEEKNVTCTTILPELWSSSVVISNAGKLWWFDLNNGGILSCDPFTQNPCSRLMYIPWCTARLTSSDVRRHSCLGLADGRIRLVRVIGRPDSPTIIMSALNSAEGPSVSDIWTDEFVCGRLGAATYTSWSREAFFYYYQHQLHPSLLRSRSTYIDLPRTEREDPRVVSMEHLKQPCFLELLDLAVQEFGYEQQGILQIPCTVQAFRSIIGAIRKPKS
ncbi:hypothetical protein HU200_031192 [Digitaria exilis]|uniref:DUF1618 domain-containing protein n=1 Tax=Digitaria exilis TaxID=1010633 RepID=A0A835BRB5_9POAL|nr:hypothetical protein HU200_031192 [Digitaria exilis]